MTWTWKIVRWGVGVGGIATEGTVDPGGWGGGACAELFKWNRFKVLNKTDEDLSSREVNLCLMQLTESYQNVSIGGQVWKMAGKLIKSEDKVKVLRDFGIDWVKGKIIDLAIRGAISGRIEVAWLQIRIESAEIEKGLKNSVLKNLFIHYLTFTQEVISPNARWWVEKVIEGVRALPRGATYESEIEVVIETLKIHELNISYLLGSQELIETERKFIWQLNEENVAIYIEEADNWEKHCEANKLVNSCLRKLRESSNSGGDSTSNIPLFENNEWENHDPDDALSFLNRLKSFLLKYEGKFKDSSELKIIEKSLRKKLEKELSKIINQVEKRKVKIEVKEEVRVEQIQQRANVFANLLERLVEKLTLAEETVEAILSPPKRENIAYI